MCDDHRRGWRVDCALSDDDVLELLCASGVVPVVVADDLDLMRPLGDALKAGGLSVAEVTFRSAAAVEALGTAHGALAMTTPGDTSTATLAEVQALAAGAGARVKR
jgi:2-keto-3-deoxy-6-phosphogluconate aldolase